MAKELYNYTFYHCSKPLFLIVANHAEKLFCLVHFTTSVSHHETNDFYRFLYRDYDYGFCVIGRIKDTTADRIR